MKMQDWKMRHKTLQRVENAIMEKAGIEEYGTPYAK